MARSLDLGCGWPISYCPAQAVYQRPGRASFSKGWESEWPLYQGQFYQGGKPQWPFYQQWPLYQGRPIQWLVESQWPFYQARWPFYQGVIKEVAVILGHLSTGFRVIECRASLSLARHDSGSTRAPASPAGAKRVASPRSPRVCSAPSASEAARRSARRPLTVVRASLCLGFRV